MYLVEVLKSEKWRKLPIMFAEIEDAESYAFLQVMKDKADNARVVDERYRRGKR